MQVVNSRYKMRVKLPLMLHGNAHDPRQQRFNFQITTKSLHRRLLRSLVCFENTVEPRKMAVKG